jgi:transposase-like protein
VATVIDSLIVQLGLDPKQFQAGANKVTETSNKTKKQLAADAKAIEDSGKQAAQFFGRMKAEALGFFAVVLGSVGLAEFTKQTIDMNANISRLSRNLGISTEALSRWEGAVREVGGAAGDADSSLQSITSLVEQLKFTGTADSQKIGILTRLGIGPADLKDSNALLLKLAGQFQKMNPADAQYLGQGLGLSPAMINLLEQGPERVRRYLGEATALTKQQAQAAEEAQEKIRAMQQRYQELGNRILTDFLPVLERVVGWLNKFATWGEQHPRLIEAGFVVITGAVTGMGVAAAIAAANFLNLARAIVAATTAGGGAGAAAAGAAAEGGAVAAGAGGLAVAAAALLGGIGGAAIPTRLGDSSRYDKSGRIKGGKVNTEWAAGIASQMGLNIGEIAGLYAESGLDPTRVNPKSGAFGIGQWLGKRLAGLKAFAAQRGTSIDNLATQLAYYKLETSGATGDAGARRAGQIDKTGSPIDALTATIGLYERPAPGAEYAGDIQRGLAFLKTHGGSSSTSTVHIGAVHIQTAATDADGIAKSIKPALENNSLITQADTGMQ